MVYDERGTVFREDIFKEPMEKYVRVHFLHRFTIIPGRRANEAVIRPLISPIEEVASEPVLQAAQRFDTFNDILYGDPFAEILKHPIAEGFKANRRKHDSYVLPLCNRQDLREVRDVSINVIYPADKIDL